MKKRPAVGDVFVYGDHSMVLIIRLADDDPYPFKLVWLCLVLCEDQPRFVSMRPDAVRIGFFDNWKLVS